MSRRLHLLELRFPLEGALYIVTQPLLRILHIKGHRHAELVLPGGMGGDGSVRITSSGINESHPHDVMITKEAPNYSRK